MCGRHYRLLFSFDFSIRHYMDCISHDVRIVIDWHRALAFGGGSYLHLRSYNLVSYLLFLTKCGPRANADACLVSGSGLCTLGAVAQF